MTPTAVSLHLSTFLTLTAAQQQPKLTHACTTPGAQHCNCRCLSLMSVIAVGNQTDCTHRPSKYLYSHIQQTSARVPKCYQSTERGNRSDVMKIYICCNYTAYIQVTSMLAMSKTHCIPSRITYSTPTSLAELLEVYRITVQVIQYGLVFQCIRQEFK